MSRVLRICRKGLSRLPGLAAVVLLLAALFLVGGFSAGLSVSQGGPEPLTCRAARAGFVHDLVVKGEIQSAAHTEVRCEVRTGRDSWVRILEVVPEGTRVEPGDFLIQLDSTKLEADRDQQRIVCQQAEAEVVRCRSVYEFAQTAHRDYLQSEYVLGRQEADLGVFVAHDRLHRAQQTLQASRKLEAQGYITGQQLRADQFAAQSAQTGLDMARTRLGVLENCTRRRKLIELKSAVAAGKAQLAAAEANAALNRQKLADLEDQIRKCTIRAPVSGTVVLAHLFHHDHSHMVEPGEMVHERRVLVRLPDYRRMQVEAKIAEERIAFVKPGLPATIRLEAFPEAELRGKVVTVNEYPDMEDWRGPDVKQYKTAVAIDTPLEGMRPGMTAELRIHVQRLDRQLQVPCQAVLRHGGKPYCISFDRGRFGAHEVSLGPSNGITTVIRAGLREGQNVVLTPGSYRDEVDLPELPGAKAGVPPGGRTGPDRLAQTQ